MGNLHYCNYTGLVPWIPIGPIHAKSPHPRWFLFQTTLLTCAHTRRFMSYDKYSNIHPPYKSQNQQLLGILLNTPWTNCIILLITSNNISLYSFAPVSKWIHQRLLRIDRNKYDHVCHDDKKYSYFISIQILKLPSLFTAWLFFTFHNKSHIIKTLVILHHSWSPFLPHACLYG